MDNFRLEVLDYTTLVGFLESYVYISSVLLVLIVEEPFHSCVLSLAHVPKADNRNPCIFIPQDQ